MIEEFVRMTAGLVYSSSIPDPGYPVEECSHDQLVTFVSAYMNRTTDIRWSSLDKNDSYELLNAISASACQYIPAVLPTWETQTNPSIPIGDRWAVWGKVGAFQWPFTHPYHLVQGNKVFYYSRHASLYCQALITPIPQQYIKQSRHTERNA